MSLFEQTDNVDTHRPPVPLNRPSQLMQACVPVTQVSTEYIIPVGISDTNHPFHKSPNPLIITCFFLNLLSWHMHTWAHYTCRQQLFSTERTADAMRSGTSFRLKMNSIVWHGFLFLWSQVKTEEKNGKRRGEEVTRERGSGSGHVIQQKTFSRYGRKTDIMSIHPSLVLH